MATRFEGRLTARDCKRNIPHSFEVPPGTAALQIDLRFSPARAQRVNNMLTLTLFDPRGGTRGFRGAGHRGGAAHRVVLSADAASPGYLPGPLPAGVWVAEIDTHMIMPGTPLTYTLDVQCVAGGAPAWAAASEPLVPRAVGDPQVVEGSGASVLRRGPGWYRGDLHCHTHHSDAEAFTVADLIQTARAVGLDFIFLTDHNTTAGHFDPAAAPTGEVLLGAGIELTTFWGHALCLGSRDWVDWRVRPGTGAMARIAAATDGAGGRFVIAHPYSDGDPRCTGCAWRFGDMMPGNARAVEVWNGPWDGDSGNVGALDLWYDWLNQGYRLTATAGTDMHGADEQALAEVGVVVAHDADADAPVSEAELAARRAAALRAAAAQARVGFNVVYAADLTQAAILGGLRAGHLYLSAGPALVLAAEDADGARWMPGDVVRGPATFTVTWRESMPGAQVRVLANGRPLHERAAEGEGALSWSLAPEDASWVLVELRDAAGAMLALTNPIWLDGEDAGRPL